MDECKPLGAGRGDDDRPVLSYAEAMSTRKPIPVKPIPIQKDQQEVDLDAMAVMLKAGPSH